MVDGGALGIIFPIPEHSAMHNVFHGRSFLVMAAHDDPPIRLDKGDRVFFYDSGETHKLIGEASIVATRVSRAGNVVEEVGRSLYLDTDGFATYLSLLPQKEDSLVRLVEYEHPTVYAAPVKCSLSIPERGLAVTREIFSMIALENV